MRCAWKAIAVVLQMAAAVGWQVEPVDAQVTETYLFRDSFAPIAGAGDVLVPVSNDTGTILTSGPGFVNGAFVTETISASACASTPTIRAWSFPVSGGLRHDNVTPTIVTGSYSISMLLRFNPMDDGYARLVDFSNSTQDTGIYKLGDGVSFYPVGEFASGSFVSDQDVFVTITRSAATQLVSLYINGLPAGTYTDTGNLYAPSAHVLYFLMDNTTGSAPITETDPGVIAYLQVRNTPMTPEEVTASLSTICTAVSCGDGIVGLGESCDDNNATSGDGCSASCAVEDCFQCSGTPSVCGPDTSGALCCAGVSNGPTFESIRCRLEALLARVNAESGLGAFQPKLVKNLDKAGSHAEEAQGLCGESNLKKARKRLKQVAKALTQYAHRLAGRAAQNKLDGTLRTDLLQAGQSITPDVKTLRTQVQCPPG